MIQQEFMNEVSKILDRGGMIIKYPLITTITYNGSESERIHKVVVDKVFQDSSFNSLLVNLTTAFMALDIHVDSKKPELEGKSFAEKFRRLNNDHGDFEKILSNLFRIFKLMRNAITHNASSVNVGGSEIEISYSFRGTDFNLKGDKILLNYLITLVWKIINNNGSYREKVLIKTFYVELIDRIREFSDDFSGQLDSLQSFRDQFVFEKIVQRYEVILDSEHYSEKDQKILLLGRYGRVHPEEEAYTECDFSIEYAGNKYLVPYEAIDNDSIPVSELEKWKV